MKELETYFSEDGLDDRLDIFLENDDEALKATVRTKKTMWRKSFQNST